MGNSKKVNRLIEPGPYIELTGCQLFVVKI